MMRDTPNILGNFAMLRHVPTFFCLVFLGILLGCFLSFPVQAGTNIPLTINLSEAVDVTGTPRIAVDVGGVTRYATYTSGTGTNALTFTYAMTAGDVDLDGVTLTSPIDLNGGTIKDLKGNDLTDLTFTPPNTANVKANFPSLGMDFVADADGRYTLNGTVYNDLPSFLTATGGTFTRASIGTYYDSTGTIQTATAGTPRFDHDPVTHAPKGILIEESRTNLIKNGEGQGASGTSYPTSGWYQNQAFGGINASSTSSGINSHGYGYFQFTINGTTAVTNRLLIAMTNPRLTVSPNTTYMLSWGVELINGTYPYGIQAQCLWYDASNNLISGSTGAYRSPIASWTRYNDSCTSPVNATTVNVRFDFSGYNTIGTPINFTMQLSGMQFEQGSFPTSYIPTTTAAVTRNADTISIPTGSWFNAPEGTSYMKSDLFLSGSSAVQQGVSIHSGGNQGYLFYKQTGSSNFYVFAGTSAANIGAVSSNTAFNSGLAYNSTTAIGALNGVLSSGFTPASVVVPTKLDISSNPAGQWNGHVLKYKYYPLKITNTQLQLMTQ